MKSHWTCLFYGLTEEIRFMRRRSRRVRREGENEWEIEDGQIPLREMIRTRDQSGFRKIKTIDGGQIFTAFV